MQPAGRGPRGVLAVQRGVGEAIPGFPAKLPTTFGPVRECMSARPPK